MAEVQKSKAKVSKNWPVLAAAGLCIVFIVGVWVNNYRVSQAAIVAAAAASHK
jgi:sensor domain CHASE-containing protein